MAQIAGGLMEHMTWPEVRDAAAAGLPVVVPMGSTEQHGPHLPLNTDCVIPVGIALEAARRLPLVVAPPIRFGAMSRPLSGGGESFPGTLSLRASTLIETLCQVLGGLARAGFRRLCVQNWHFENAAYLWEACDLAAAAHPDIRILVLEDPMPEFSAEELARLFPRGFPGWDVEHASIMETSLMYVLEPGLVRRELIADDQAGRHPSWDVVPAPADFIPRSGVLWHPSEAGEEIGRMFFEAGARRLESALRTEFGL
ncbi:MAG: creatininase [Candidatus Dormibacterales bacterium]